MPQPDWQGRLVSAIADEIRRRRENRKMSAQQLATACAKLGLSISRSTLADLENGRRATLTVAELLVIAAALEVEPLRLLVPLNDGDVELLPDVKMSPWTATLKFVGLDSDKLKLLVEYDDDEQKLRSLLTRSTRGGMALDVPERKAIPSALGALARTRQRFAALGLAEPEMPADLQKMLETPYLLNGGPAERKTMPEPATTPEPQPVATAIVTSRQGVLVGKRNDGKPPWTFIAGEVEPGETASFAAVREVKEETGLETQASHEIGRRVHPRTGRTMIYIAVVPMRPDDLDVFVGDSEELAEVRWVSLAEADELMEAYGMFEPVHDYLAATIGGGN
jgi:8-oxo-dGTP pyrophosphatase MutT (NUDIX family)/transcriptional regulator with XRE-family HTH domain